jgi:hypothetical protein
MENARLDEILDLERRIYSKLDNISSEIKYLKDELILIGNQLAKRIDSLKDEIESR